MTNSRLPSTSPSLSSKARCRFTLCNFFSNWLKSLPLPESSNSKYTSLLSANHSQKAATLSFLFSNQFIPLSPLQPSTFFSLYHNHFHAKAIVLFVYALKTIG